MSIWVYVCYNRDYIGVVMSSARRRFLRNASISSQSIVPAAKSMLNLRPGSTEYIQYDVSGLASGFIR